MKFKSFEYLELLKKTCFGCAHPVLFERTNVGFNGRTNKSIYRMSFVLLNFRQIDGCVTLLFTASPSRRSPVLIFLLIIAVHF